MKYLRYILILISAASVVSCAHKHDDAHEANDVEKAEKEENSHEGLIVLSEKQLDQLHVEATSVSPGTFSDVLKVSGEISAMPGSEGTVVARQGGIVKLTKGISEGATVKAGSVIATISSKGMAGGDPNESARVAYDAAKRELERLAPLHKEGIVSTRDYNAALQRLNEAKVLVGAGSARNSAATALVSGIITAINVTDGSYVETGQPIAAVSSSQSLTLRADVPESQAANIQNITDARFRPSYSDELIDIASVGGHRISKGNAGAQSGYIAVYFYLPNSGQNIINGTYCDVYLLGNDRENVIAVPESSISEQQGKYFVYLEVQPGHFRKQPVTLGASDGIRREILSGLNSGDRLVTEGMTYVRLAETSGVVPEGHTHNH